MVRPARTDSGDWGKRKVSEVCIWIQAKGIPLGCGDELSLGSSMGKC